MQPPNEMTADHCSLLPRKIQPAEHAVRFTALDPADSPQAVTLDQHRNSVQMDRPQGLLTGGTVIPAFDIAMNFDVLATDFGKVSTSFVITPLLLMSRQP